MSLSSFFNEEPARIANVFLDLATAEGHVLSNMKLQKLVYITFGFYSAFADERLFADEIQAWEFGPVIPSLYHRLKKYGPGIVKEKLRVLRNIKPGTLKYEVIEAVWNRYKHLSAMELSALIRQEDSPWGKTWEEGRRNLVIPFETIRDYYKTKSARI